MLRFFNLEKRIPIFAQLNNPSNQLLLRPDLYELTKFMLSIHIFNMNKEYEKVNHLVFETYYKNKFDDIKPDFESLFTYLTNRSINIEFIKKVERSPYQRPLFFDEQNYLLYSGGLDSLCGLSELTGQPNNLIHVITNNQILGMVRRIGLNYKSRQSSIFYLDTRTSALSGGPSNTRGLVFFTFAYSIAKHFENNQIHFAENGSQMLDVMLSPFAFPNKPALKNTNPIFISKLVKILDRFDSPFRINLMNKNSTKSEMLSKYANTIPFELTNSCFTTRGKSSMCGICYNCFIRNLSMSSIKIFEQDYTYDPFTNIVKKTRTYNKRQRILYQIIRFYYKVLSKESSALEEITLSSKGYFDDPISLSTKFASDLFLGIRNYFETYEPTNLNALGNKANELLSFVDPEIIDDREFALSQI